MLCEPQPAADLKGWISCISILTPLPPVVVLRGLEAEEREGWGAKYGRRVGRRFKGREEGR